MFWDVVPCSVIILTLMMEAGSCSEMLFTTKLDGATSQKTTIVILVAMTALIFHLCCICCMRREKENVIAVSELLCKKKFHSSNRWDKNG